MLLTWLTAAIIFSVDFLVKVYLRTNFPLESIPIIDNFLHITVVFNSGAAFGILQGKTSLLISIGIIFILFFLNAIKNEIKNSYLIKVACGFILGGAISNLYDRISLGYVVDYIDFRIWPVFNISDTCITTGVGILLFQSLRKNPKKHLFNYKKNEHRQ